MSSGESGELNSGVTLSAILRQRKRRYKAVGGETMKTPGIVAILSVVLLSFACNKGLKNAGTELPSVQVTEYKGEKLGSIEDFRENSIKGPQQIDVAGYRLDVSGLADTPRSYTYEEVLAHPKYSKVVTLNCVEGWSVKVLWEGVLVEDFLKEAGVKPLANTVIFHAADGYTTSLPLSYIRDRQIIMAYMMNGVTLPPARGFPLELVAEDKLGYKWIRWITGIELSNDPSYKGFWESRGYDNDADVN